MPILSCPVPNTISTLSPNGFIFTIQKYPELDYFIQEVQLPSISLGSSVFATNVHDLKMPGETLEFADLTVNFLVDENMTNYLAIQDWMFGLGFPAGHELYRGLLQSERNAANYGEVSKTVSDCFLTVLNSDNRPLKRFQFVDAFPTDLSALTFQSTNTDVQYLVASATFTYSYYSLG